MLAFAMAARALRVVESVVVAECSVRVMTRDATQGAGAFPKARQLAEVHRLVADIPWQLPVDLYSRRGRFAVALAAEGVHRICSEASWIADRVALRCRRHMCAARAVAGFA